MSKFTNMNKTLVLIITLITSMNVSYASFPVNQNTQAESVETIEPSSYGDSQPILGVLSLSLSVVGLILLFTPAIAFAPILTLFAIIFGVLGLFRKSSRMLSILGLLLAPLSLLVFLLVLSLIAWGGVGAAFGG